MQQKAIAVAVKTKAKRKCIHHWMIDDDDKGVCIFCGEERQFTRRGDIDWESLRPWVIGKEERVILPYITSEV